MYFVLSEVNCLKFPLQLGHNLSIYHHLGERVGDFSNTDYIYVFLYALVLPTNLPSS